MNTCGEPTISVLDKVLAEGTLADFVSVNWDNFLNSYTLTIAPINYDQAGKTYTFELEVVLASYGISFISPKTVEVNLISDPCLSAILTIDS